MIADACLSAFIVFIAVLYMAFLYTGVVWPVSLQGQELLKSWGIGSKSIFRAVIVLETVIPAIVAIPVTYRISKKSKLLATISTAIIFVTILFTERAMYSFETELVVKNLVLYPMIGWTMGMTMGILIARVIVFLTSRRHVFSKPA